MRTILVRWLGPATLAAVVVVVAGCGDDDSAEGMDAVSIVVTSNILGDIVHELVGDEVTVEVLMPPNADPHDFAASARQAADLRNADVVVTNGLGFEAGLEDTIDAAADDGVDVIEVAELAPDHLSLEEEGHGEEDPDESEGEEHGHGSEDPHVFTDPARMAVATAALAELLAERVEGLDTSAFRARADAYVDQLERLDAEVEQILSVVPADRRVLVTNHDVFGYFADRYGFEILGTVIPSLSTIAEPSAEGLAALADAVAQAGVPAVFADTSAPARLADALAAEGTNVEVVELYSESLGGEGSGAATYVEMIRTDAERIADALAG